MKYLARLTTRLMLFTYFFFVIRANTIAQIHVNSLGEVGIGVSNPSEKLDAYGSQFLFDYTNQPFKINVSAFDPRLCSTERIVFYNMNNTGFIDIHYKTAYEYSDLSAKENIKVLDKGALDRVKRLEGITYNWKSDKSGKRHVGFIAQDVEDVIPEIIHTVDSSGEKGVAYSHLIPYLVESIKEMDDKIEAQRRIINEQQKFLSNGRNSNAGANLFDSTEIILHQNSPNPFNKQTEIKVTLPQAVLKAYLSINDLNGKQLKHLEIEERNEVNIIIDGNELKAGIYLYSLIVDGELSDTKRMMLTK